MDKNTPDALRAIAARFGSDDGVVEAVLVGAADDIETLEAHLRGLIRYADAVRSSAGIGRNQLARLDAAKAYLGISP